MNACHWTVISCYTCTTYILTYPFQLPFSILPYEDNWSRLLKVRRPSCQITNSVKVPKEIQSNDPTRKIVTSLILSSTITALWVCVCVCPHNNFWHRYLARWIFLAIYRSSSTVNGIYQGSWLQAGKVTAGKQFQQYMHTMKNSRLRSKPELNTFPGLPRLACLESSPKYWNYIDIYCYGHVWHQTTSANYSLHRRALRFKCYHSLCDDVALCQYAAAAEHLSQFPHPEVQN